MREHISNRERKIIHDLLALRFSIVRSLPLPCAQPFYWLASLTVLCLQELEVTWADLHGGEDVPTAQKASSGQESETNVAMDSEDGEQGRRRPLAKAPRMTTGKKKKANYYSTANVKNRRR